MEQLRVAILSGLRVHPRVAQQKLGLTVESRERLLAALPALVPFRGAPPREITCILDWDHRLPSQRLILRVHLNYDTGAASLFSEEFSQRVHLIAARDKFPEFDVPDFEELPADEIYEAELTPQLTLESIRLTSPWRREIDDAIAERAVQVVRSSAPFARIRAAETSRPTHLGDLDPVSWMPPCESGHPHWTVDVWWLTSFDGRIGTGWSFLVEPDAGGAGGGGTLVTHREFQVRSG